MRVRGSMILAFIVLIPVLMAGGSQATLGGTKGVVTGSYFMDDLCDSPEIAQLKFVGSFSLKGIGFVGSAHTTPMLDPDCIGPASNPFKIFGGNAFGAKLAGNCTGSFALDFFDSIENNYAFVAHVSCAASLTNQGGKSVTGQLKIPATGYLIQDPIEHLFCMFGACIGPGVTSGDLVGTYVKS